MSISPARTAAFEILLKIERDRAFSSILLPEYESDLTERDAALCHQLVLGTLRRQMYLDAAVTKLAGARRLDTEVLIALRLGLYQILELDRIPHHSAVNESVALVQRAKKTSAKGFVNALLRRAIREGVQLEFPDDLERISIETSHPRWLIERWMERFGAERALAIARANNDQPRIAFRLTRNGIERDVQVPETCRGSDVVTFAFLSERMTPDLLEMAERAEIYFQDEASQLVAHLVGDVGTDRVLDVCSAPGGKTSMIAQMNPDASVAAGDLYQVRVEFLRESCQRQGLDNVYVVRYDAEQELPFPDQAFDAILVDAPCSGTGTIRSNPEIRYFLAPEDFRTLPFKQLRILTNASKLLTPRGRLFYSTCSLERDENEQVIGTFLDANPEFEAVQERMPESLRTDEGFGRTFPDRDGTDGFFFAELRRKREL